MKNSRILWQLYYSQIGFSVLLPIPQKVAVNNRGSLFIGQKDDKDDKDGDKDGER